MSNRMIRFLTIVTIIVIVIVWRLAMPSGYYDSPEIAFARTLEFEDGTQIASFYNGTEPMMVMLEYDKISFYNFIPRKTLTGVKYGARFAGSSVYKHNELTEICPDKKDWDGIQMPKRSKDIGMKNLDFTVVKKSDSLQLDSDIMQFEYDFEGRKYLLLCRLLETT